MCKCIRGVLTRAFVAVCPELLFGLKPVLEIEAVCPPALDIGFVRPRIDFLDRWFIGRNGLI
jgi:hypothetical protein